MSWIFHPPPGWPPPPAGWLPPPGWVPDPSWPPAPPGWQFWVPAAAAPGPDLPATAAVGGRPWFGRWWAIPGLVALLLVGSVVGYGGTRVGLELAGSDDPPVGAGTGGPDGGAGPGGAAPTPTPDRPSAAPTPVGPTTAPPPAGLGADVCGEVALIMLAVVAASSDPGQHPDLVVDAWREAAGDLRELADSARDRPGEDSLEALADELDAAADTVGDHPGDLGAFETSFSQLAQAYESFNERSC